jgi:phosphonatase-like hydrolase
MTLKLVVFDMAGTAVEEQNSVYKAIHQAIVWAGYDCSLDTVLAIAAGKEKRQAITDVLTHLIDDEPFDDVVDAIHEEFKHKLEVVYKSGVVRAMPDAEHVFETLRNKNIKIALNTGYNRSVAEMLLQQIGWTIPKTFDVLVTASDVDNGRPEPDMILNAMAQLGIANAKYVAKIGDSAIDIIEGQNAGCGLTAGVLTGAQNHEQLAAANPTHIFESLTDLLQYI